VALATLVAAAAVVIGCGESAQNREARKLESLSVLSNTRPLSDRLIKPTEIGSSPDQAGVRTFLQLWSLLQYVAVNQAELLFAPGLRSAVGTALLAQALDTEQLIWQGTKPRISSASLSGGQATISFVARDETDKLLPASITFRGGEGKWRVVYFSLLNGAIQRAVQLRVQAKLEPLATKPSVEAVRQGDSAGALQSFYLERLFRSEAATAKP